MRTALISERNEGSSGFYEENVIVSDSTVENLPVFTSSAIWKHGESYE